MARRIPRVSLCVLLMSMAIASNGRAQSQWVAAVAHTPGVGDSVWRSDLSVLNLCPEPATVELTLHGASGVSSAAYTVEGGALQVFQDVVGQLTAGDVTGSLEVDANRPVLVSSRTFNLASSGTYGQSLDGVSAEAGLTSGDRAYLQPLREDGGFRSNVGLLNMGATPAVVEVSLHDRLGVLVGTFRSVVAAGRLAQDNRPFLIRFGRDDIVGGYARVAVVTGSGVWAYASVVDNGTDDPTTVTMKAAPDCDVPVDIRDRLAAVDGMTVTELSTSTPGYRYFRLSFVQPADHDHPNGGEFQQYLTLMFRSYGAPMVLETEGYANLWRDSRAELTTLLEANQLTVEHRFFDTSTPVLTDWSLLTIAQAAADHHRIVEALKPIFTGPWISSGHSKGGMTAVYHRRFYPGDVIGTVPYVAPISFGAPDQRYVDFVASVGEAACRDRLTALQREVLGRRQAMLDLMAISPRTSGLSFARIGGPETAFEAVVLELPFTFWQYAGEGYCGALPELTDSDADLFVALDRFVGFSSASDDTFDFFEPYYYQAQTQLGYPALASDHLADLLVTDAATLEAGLLPDGVTAVYEPTVMPDVGDWVATEGLRLLFVYGEYDPWAAGAFELGNAADSFRFDVVHGTHGAHITALPAADREQVYDILERWTGVRPTAKSWTPDKPDQYPPWRRHLRTPPSR